MDMGGLLAFVESDSLVVSDTGAMANLARFSWLERQNRILRRARSLCVSTDPASARFRFVDGRLGDVRHATGTPVGSAGGKGEFTAFALDAHIA